MRIVRPPVTLTWRLPLLIGLAAAGVGVWILRPSFEQATAWASRGLVRVGEWTANRIGPAPSVRQLTRERDALRSQLLAVSLELSETKRQLETSQTLESLQAFLEEQSFRTVTAAIIAYSPDPGVESIVIQRGTAQGVVDGLAVITDRGIVVGTVIRTQTTTAVVRLLTDSQSRLLGKVQNQAQSRGLVVGERGLSLAMQFLPHQDQIAAGQTVVTSGLDPRIPPDLLIGTVEGVNLRAGELFQTARLRSPVEFSRLRVVAVVLGRQ